MSNPYCPFCDDFYVNMRLGSQLALPNSRETVLHFFERVQKAFPAMGRLRKGEGGEVTLEEDRRNPSYRWASLEARRLYSGHVNPQSLDETLKLHGLLLELAPFHLGVSPLEIDYLDLLFGFDLNCTGNHDEIVADSLFADSPLSCLAEEPGARPVDFQPSVIVALSDDCRLQARIDVVTRTNSYQVRTGDYSEDAISVYLILRRYWGDRPTEPLEKIFAQMLDRADTLANHHVMPKIVKSISSAIASRS